MRVLVTGGRDFSDYSLLFEVMDQIHSLRPIMVVMHGAARGADSLAGAWARDRGIVVEQYLAKWAEHGKAAGPIRNQQMLDASPDMVVAFPGGSGTADMVRRARAAGVTVMIV